jgi:hypothetical protein
MDTGGIGISISMWQMNGSLFNHSVHLSSVRWPRLVRRGQWTVVMDSGVLVSLAIPSYLFVGDGEIEEIAR